jgi:hypothetical protein
MPTNPTKTNFRGKLGKIPESSMDAGQGFIKKNYGPDDSTQSEQMQALQNRAQKLQGKALKMSNPIPPVIDSLKQVEMPLQKIKR